MKLTTIFTDPLSTWAIGMFLGVVLANANAPFWVWVLVAMVSGGIIGWVNKNERPST